ncbi:DUF3226 domain-containing protein [Planococcus lenghuensis]|uniref:Uncharacterized protein n=1 Tax=Planococcus lenghuensis TaxID=2213202 RepID=A0A1Q2KWR1_9BACL|nr:DUF3226 domain-containing protein [Planococcus lenghuensis]AQQ52247.1 hypothetical protein B0X71_03385 [Planococcus lenghuensis]
MSKYYFFVVEGVHDTAAIGKILRKKGFSNKRLMKDVDSYWERIIPKSFPHNGDLQKRVPTPDFYQNDAVSIGVLNAGGETEIASAIEGSLLNLSIDDLNGIAIFCDADSLEAKDKFDYIYKSIQNIEDEEIRNFFYDVQFNNIKNSNCKAGIFIFPDNNSTGTLEDFLLLGGEREYADLYDSAQLYIENIPDTYTSKWKPSSKNKVLVGVIANVLKPGKANQVSILDNEWITEESLKDTNQKELKGFLDNLLI